jgi:hypothetical protein
LLAEERKVNPQTSISLAQSPGFGSRAGDLKIFFSVQLHLWVANALPQIGMRNM